MCVGGPLEVNIGVMYVQNAAPDGPVAWMFAEVPDRALRYVRPDTFYIGNESVNADGVSSIHLAEGGARPISSSHPRQTLS